MPAFETLLLLLLAAGAVGLAVVLYIALRPGRRGEAVRAFEAGDREAAVARGRTSEERGERLVAAVAARQLLDLAAAEEILDTLLREDPSDGEAWFERGLTAAYAGDAPGAEEAFARAEARRSDLTEPAALARAWLALDGGDRGRARRIFEEVEAPFETKLRDDLGSADPAFVEWFLQAAALWRAAGAEEKAAWALDRARGGKPGPALTERLTLNRPSL